MSETAESGRWFEKCIGDAEDEQVFVLILHNVVTNAQLCRRSLLFLGLPDQPLISAAELCLPLPVSISTIISCTGFPKKLSCTEFFPKLLSVWWAVVTLLLPLLWLSSPGRQLSWVSRIAGPCWPICQESITGCTVPCLLEGCHHLIMYT